MNEEEQNHELRESSTEQPKQNSRRAVNLAYELATLQDALGLARIVGDAIRAETLDDDDEVRRALSGLSSLLSLVGCRMKDLGRVAAGFADPLVLLAPHNEALDIVGELEEAVHLTPWPAKRQRRWLRAELRRIRTEIAAPQSGRKRRPSG